MITRRSFFAALVAMVAAPLDKLLPKRNSKYFLAGWDPAYGLGHDKCVIVMCINPGGLGPLRFEWISPEYRPVGRDGVKRIIKVEKAFAEWGNLSK